METIKNESQIILPRIPCPICGDGRVVIDEVDGWIQDSNGTWKADSISLTCITEPSMGKPDEWEEWHKWHFSHPYIDWLPLTERVKQWINERYRWDR